MIAALACQEPVPVRLRRVNVVREASDATVAAVLPDGYVRPATQGLWRTAMRDALEGAMLRKDWHSTLHAVATRLMLDASWDTLTTRPGWDALVAYLRRTTGRGSRRAVARAIATLIDMKLIARVSGGRRGCFAPGGHLSHRKVDWQAVPDTNLPTDPDNERAVYVLLVPAGLRALPSPPQAVEESGTPPCKGLVSEAHPVRAREDDRSEPLRGAQTHVAAQAPPPSPVSAHRNAELWPGWATTGTDGARLSAAAELQRRLPVLRQISTRDLRACLREFFLAGWTVQDVHHALDWTPDGTRWPHDGAHGITPSTVPGHRRAAGVRGWLRYRLAPWTTEGTPRRSFSQRAAAQRTEQIARQQAERESAAAERARYASAPPPILRAARAHIGHVRWHQIDPTCQWCTEPENTGDPLN